MSSFVSYLGAHPWALGQFLVALAIAAEFFGWLSRVLAKPLPKIAHFCGAVAELLPQVVAFVKRVMQMFAPPAAPPSSGTGTGGPPSMPSNRRERTRSGIFGPIAIACLALSCAGAQTSSSSPPPAHAPPPWRPVVSQICVAVLASQATVDGLVPSSARPEVDAAYATLPNGCAAIVAPTLCAALPQLDALVGVLAQRVTSAPGQSAQTLVIEASVFFGLRVGVQIAAATQCPAP